MKKLLVIAFSVLALAASAFAQPRALGLRGGYGAELSYQHDLGGNFLEADLGFFANNGFYLTGVYDFIIGSEGSFNFYAGPGAQVGFYNAKNDEGNTVSGINLAVVGQLGMEYQFPSAPLNISLDWRPAFNFVHGGFGWNGFALGIRYRF